MQETQVWFLGWEDSLKKEMATHSSILAWRIPWTEEPGRLQSMGLEELGHDLATKPLPPYVCIYAWETMHMQRTLCRSDSLLSVSNDISSSGSWLLVYFCVLCYNYTSTLYPLPSRHILNSFFFFQENFILFFLIYFILLFNFTILYWFCHISTWIHHRYTCFPHPEPFLLPPCTIPLGRPSALALSIQYHASNLDWWPFLILTWLFTQQIIQ